MLPLLLLRGVRELRDAEGEAKGVRVVRDFCGDEGRAKNTSSVYINIE